MELEKKESENTESPPIVFDNDNPGVGVHNINAETSTVEKRSRVENIEMKVIVLQNENTEACKYQYSDADSAKSHNKCLNTEPYVNVNIETDVPENKDNAKMVKIDAESILTSIINAMRSDRVENIQTNRIEDMSVVEEATIIKVDFIKNTNIAEIENIIKNEITSEKTSGTIYETERESSDSQTAEDRNIDLNLIFTESTNTKTDDTEVEVVEMTKTEAVNMKHMTETIVKDDQSKSSATDPEARQDNYIMPAIDLAGPEDSNMKNETMVTLVEVSHMENRPMTAQVKDINLRNEKIMTEAVQEICMENESATAVVEDIFENIISPEKTWGVFVADNAIRKSALPETATTERYNGPLLENNTNSIVDVSGGKSTIAKAVVAQNVSKDRSQVIENVSHKRKRDDDVFVVPKVPRRTVVANSDSSLTIACVNDEAPDNNNCEIQTLSASEPSSSFSAVQPRIRREFEYISNDPEENADNFNPKWNSLRSISTDGERYRSIRKMWKNLSIPNPDKNLTFRHQNSRSSDNVTKAEKTGSRTSSIANNTSKRSFIHGGKTHARSRSCTSLYEDFISRTDQDFNKELQSLVNLHQLEVSERKWRQIDQQRQLGMMQGNPYVWAMAVQSMETSQQREMQNLMQSHEERVRQVESKRRKEIAVYKMCMMEVRAFNSFYHGLLEETGKEEDPLLLSKEQEEHLVETERMYEEYKKMYRPT